VDVPRRIARERVPTSHTRGHADTPTRRHVSPSRRPIFNATLRAAESLRRKIALLFWREKFRSSLF